MNHSMRHASIWLWLTLPIAILLAIAAGSGLFVTGLYRDVPSVVAQAVGQDLVSLAIVLPTLIVTAILASRGSSRARLIWLGGLVYLVYCYALAAFDVRFNPLFLVYVALLGCSLYALIGGLATTDMAEIKAAFAGLVLSYFVLLVLAIVSTLVFMARNGDPVAVQEVAIFGILLASGLGMLIWYISRTPQGGHFCRLMASRTNLGLQPLLSQTIGTQGVLLLRRWLTIGLRARSR